MNIFPLNLTRDTNELKRLIAEYPNYPIVVLAGENAIIDEGYWTYCSDISFSIIEILDCETPFRSEYVFNDRDEFETSLDKWIDDKHSELSEKEFQELLKEETLEKYEPFWKHVIAIRANN